MAATTKSVEFGEKLGCPEPADGGADTQVPGCPHTLLLHLIVLPYADGVYPLEHASVASE